MPGKRVPILRDGEDRVIEFPPKFEFKTDWVTIRKEDDHLVIEPLANGPMEEASPDVDEI